MIKIPLQLNYTSMVYLFCPKDNQIDGFEMKLQYIWKQGRANNHYACACPNRLSGQNLTLKYAARSRTATIKGKKYRTGINGYLFAYLANMLKFNPHFELLFLHKRGAWKIFRKKVKKICNGLSKFIGIKLILIAHIAK